MSSRTKWRRTPHVWSSRVAQRRSETCIRGWAQLLEDEDLSDSTSFTAKSLQTHLRLPYPFFLEIAKQYNSHSLTPHAPGKKHTKSVCSIRRAVRRVATPNPVGKITDQKPETCVFSPLFGLHIYILRPSNLGN